MGSLTKIIGTFFYRALITMLRLTALIIFRLKISGIDSLYAWKEKNNKPVIIVARHHSWWDPILIAASISFLKDIRPVYIAKQELKKYFNYIPWANNHILFINRTTTSISSFREMVQTVKNSKDIVIFPEGTTIPEKKAAHRGVINILKRFSEIPIIPINIIPQGPYGKPQGKWYHYLFGRVKIHLKIGPPLFLDDLNKKAKGSEGKASALLMVEALLKAIDKI